MCAQVHSMITNLAQFTDIRIALVVGGLSLQVQAATLRTSPEVIVATPVSAPLATCHEHLTRVRQANGQINLNLLSMQ